MHGNRTFCVTPAHLRLGFNEPTDVAGTQSLLPGNEVVWTLVGIPVRWDISRVLELRGHERKTGLRATGWAEWDDASGMGSWPATLVSAEMVPTQRATATLS